MTRRLTAVLSRGLSRHPEKLALEESLLTSLRDEARLATVVVPNLYDLRSDGPGGAELRKIDGDMIVLSWMYPRGSHWILNFHGVDGQVGETQLANSTSHDEDASLDDEQVADEKQRVIASRPPRERKIYCLDLRTHSTAAPYLEEIRRIIDTQPSCGPSPDSVSSDRSPESCGRSPESYGRSPDRVTPDHASSGCGRSPDRAESCGRSPDRATPDGESSSGDQGSQLASKGNGAATSPGGMRQIDAPVGRRWYPVIDFSRCTNCMECVDFCLFGVYGIDDAETILVELPDNCRKGCPACSRVCPEQAIIFPQHKTPAIAGAAVDHGSMKIDLSKLFGAPDDADNSTSQAERERDEQLQQVAHDVALPTDARTTKPPQPRDELDDLIDELDDADL